MTRRIHCLVTQSVVAMLAACNPVIAQEKAGTAVPPALYVSPKGSDQNTGYSIEKALKSPSVAVDRAGPGTVVYFDSGTYLPLKIEKKNGTKEQPIIFRTVPGQERKATFSSGKLEWGIAISVQFCSYVQVRDLRAADSLKGITFDSVSDCIMAGNLVENLGQEALHVGRLRTFDGTNMFLGPTSTNVQVLENTVTGTGKVKPQYGEGIYIGTGAFLGDDTHHILIEGNTLSDISAEAIELKPGTHDIVVRRNVISNTHHEYNGAITVAVEGSATEDGNFLIESNVIWDIKKIKHSVSGIAIGHGNAVIRNNIIWGVDGGAGIRVYQTFANPKALTITITNNTIGTGGDGKLPRITLHNGTGSGKISPHKAIIQAKNNLTDDGSAGSVTGPATIFAGPLNGNADAGKGPGSGFRIVKYNGVGADYSKIPSPVDPKKPRP